MVFLDRWVVHLAAAHTIVVVIHSAAHVTLGILPSTPIDIAIIGGVIFAGPIVAAVLVMSRLALRIGRSLFFVSMLGSLIYGALSHFALPGPDNVALLTPEGMGLVFIATTAVLAIIEGIGVILGALLLRTRPGTPATGA